MTEKIVIQREAIGVAFVPNGLGGEVIPISKVSKNGRPKASEWRDVWDMNGIMYRNIHRNSIRTGTKESGPRCVIETDGLDECQKEEAEWAIAEREQEDIHQILFE